MSKPILYHVPPSFYSQLARITLAEKGVEYESRYVVAGPPTFESYRPWYMRLNPGGTVPTLVHGEVVLDDSSKIIRYVDQKFGGYALIPSENSFTGEVDRWVERLRGVSLRDLTYGSDSIRGIGQGVNGARLKRLRKLAGLNPELREIYLAKAASIEEDSERAQDAAHVERERAKILAFLDEAEQRLGEGPWLAGPRYTLADALWTVGVARFLMIKLSPFEGRPRLQQWYERVKERPSFSEADIWERFKPTALLKVMASKIFG